RLHSVPLGTLVGLSHATWLRTNVAQWTVISGVVFLSLSTVAPPPRDRSSRAGRIGCLAHTAIPPHTGPHRTENPSVDERSMQGVFPSSRADTKLGICHG